MKSCDVWGNGCEKADAICAPKRLARLVEDQEGRAGWAILWLLGIPIPVLVVLFLFRGCT